MTGHAHRVHVRDESDLHMAVASVRQAAKALGFPPARELAAATCASELATNILKYAGRGWVAAVPAADGAGLVVTAEDKGPGIPDVALAMRDHFSTSGTLGLGLPGVRRMADRFEIASAPGKGTRVEAEFRVDRPPPPAAPLRAPSACAGAPPSLSSSSSAVLGVGASLETGAHRRPAPGEVRCGDRTLVWRGPHAALLAVVDGLGHGPPAAAAAASAVEALEDAAASPAPPAELLALVHRVLRGTRGAAAGVVRVDMAGGTASAASVGNVLLARYARFAGAGDTAFVGVDGILGSAWRTPRETRVKLADGDLLLLASDGLPARFSPADLPALRHGTPAVLATEAVERFGKFHDDACCLLARWRGGNPALEGTPS